MDQGASSGGTITPTPAKNHIPQDILFYDRPEWFVTPSWAK